MSSNFTSLKMMILIFSIIVKCALQRPPPPQLPVSTGLALVYILSLTIQKTGAKR